MNKKQALFEAVIQLLEEDADIHSMKVSDITARAGIGKGTAYEYFSSKEEMIAKAIAWYGEKEFSRLTEQLRNRGSLEDQIFCILDFIETDMCESRSCRQILKLQSHSCEIEESLHKEYSGCEAPEYYMERIFEQLYEQGIKEGSIEPLLPKELANAALLPGFVAYFMYSLQEEKKKEVLSGQMKRFICRSMLLALALPPESV